MMIGLWLLLIVFIRIEKKVSQPMIDLELFGNMVFSSNLSTGFISFVGLAGALSDRVGTRRITVVGLAIILVGFLLAGTLSRDTSAWGYLLRMFVLGLGIGTFVSLNNSAIMGAIWAYVHENRGKKKNPV